MQCFSASFSSQLKATNVFQKHILKSKVWDQSKQARKKLLDNKTWFVLKFLSKLKACGDGKSKNRYPCWLYCTVVGLLPESLLWSAVIGLVKYLSLWFTAGFPTGAENMGRMFGGWRGAGRGALQSLMGVGLESIHGGSMGGLRQCWKIPVREFIC